MRIITPFAFLLLFQGVVVAQNWSPINTEETFYYDSGGEEMTGIRVDSVAVVEEDTVWFTNLLVDLHPELEVNAIPCSEFDAQAAIMHAGFMQFEIISEGAGVYKFQNPDTFEIHAKATVGSEWVYSHLFGEEEVLATVMDVVSTSVLSQTDSVKFISLSDGRNIMLSKNHGLIEFESVSGNAYEISGIADRQLGEYPIGYHEIFDFAPGDVFVYLMEGGYSEQMFKKLTRIEIEEVADNGEGTEIQYEEIVYQRTWVMSNQMPFIFSEINPQFYINEYAVLLPDTGLPPSDQIPNSFIYLPFGSLYQPFLDIEIMEMPFRPYVYLDEVNDRNLKVFGGTTALSQSVIACAEQFENLSLDNDGCYPQSETVYNFSDYYDGEEPFVLNDTAVVLEGNNYCISPYEFFAYGEGLGVISHESNSGLAEGYEVMVGYRKGDEEFGYIPSASEILSVGDELAGALPAVTVFPVPAVDQLHLSRTDAQTYRIFDVSGKPVLQGTLLGASEIDVSKLAAGIYNGHLLRDDQPIGQFRFVKR